MVAVIHAQLELSLTWQECSKRTLSVQHLISVYCVWRTSASSHLVGFGFQTSRSQLQHVANTPLCVHSQENLPLHLYKFSQSTHELACDLWGRSGRKSFPPGATVTGAARNTAMMQHVTHRKQHNRQDPSPKYWPIGLRTPNRVACAFIRWRQAETCIATIPLSRV